jgi:molecular chaperone DnaK
MKQTHAVGIDLGTTYSCIAWLNEFGQPVTIPNEEGELSTPSVVFFDGDHPVVGTEALRNAIASPHRVIQHAKRYMGDPNKFWRIDETRYSPVHVSGMILRKLVAAAQLQIGEIREAVITVPAQFSDAQRHATMLAGHAAGLEHIEMINEPVAAALCHVLGNEGLAFTELAIDQQLLVFDLGGGTLDLAIVKYKTNEVRVVAADGDLELGGLDWTRILVDEAARRFVADGGSDPREDLESLQFLALEAEQAKRSLSVRPRAAVTVQHEGQRKTYQIEQPEFETLSRRLIQRCEEVTRRILKDNKFGWAHIDVVLTTGGASRMPMVKDFLKRLSGRTLNSSLSPDQSIAHGAAYYAGMLLANQKYVRTVFNSVASSRLSRVKQQSVNARSLGILIRDDATGQRVPHYLIPANTPLPVAKTHVFGTVVDNQNRVHVRIVESGAGADRPPTVLGDCEITDLPPNLPAETEIEVTISYDHQARVHVSAREPVSGRRTEIEIIRQENLNAQLEHPLPAGKEPSGSRPAGSAARSVPVVTGRDAAAPEVDPFKVLSGLARPSEQGVVFDQPVLLCNECGTPLDRNGRCVSCPASQTPVPAAKAVPRGKTVNPSATAVPAARPARQSGKPVEKPGPASSPRRKAARPVDPPRADSAEAEFWDLVDTEE